LSASLFNPRGNPKNVFNGMQTVMLSASGGVVVSKIRQPIHMGAAAFSM
jgi:hypothetical protein